MEGDAVTGDAVRRRAAALLATLACVLLAVGLVAPPAQAARPARAGAMWATNQYPSGSTVAVRLTWAKVSGATAYDIDYVAPRSGKAVTGAQIQASSRKRTFTIRGTSSSLQAARVPGLAAGTVYCFQVRGRNRSAAGSRSGAYCKRTAEAARVVRAASVPLAVGTFNLCSSTRSCATTIGSWDQRRALVVRRIRELRVGATARPVDVLGINEGNSATDDLAADLDGTFTQGCWTGNRPGGRSWENNQSLWVRDTTYAIRDETRGGLQFANDPAHGACWVTVRERRTGAELVVVGLHLWVDDRSTSTNDDAVRATQMTAVHQAVTAANPGARIVYVGDFNSHRNHTVDGPRVRLEAQGFDDAYDESVRYENRPLYNSACGTDGTIRKSYTWGDHVDRVFAPAGVHVAAWKVDYRVASTTRYALPLPSDHNPVVVELSIPHPTSGVRLNS